VDDFGNQVAEGAVGREMVGQRAHGHLDSLLLEHGPDVELAALEAELVGLSLALRLIWRLVLIVVVLLMSLNRRGFSLRCPC
jgi:hypothetical protein